MLYAEQLGLYTSFRAEVSDMGISKIYAVFEQGEAALGVPTPDEGKLKLRVSVPTSRLPGGKLLHGMLVQRQGEWQDYPGGCVGSLTLPKGKKRGNLYRFPWKPGQRLPCEELMCFFRYVGNNCLEIELDVRGTPKV